MVITTQVTPASPVFSFESNQLSVSIDEHGDPWFIASEVCAILGIRNPRDAMSRLDDDEKGVGKTDTLGGVQEVTTISEPGLYRLIGRSNKPTAKRFNRWVCHEVLPTIRKTGRYQMPDSPTISPAQQRALQDAIAARFPEGKQRPYAWSRFNNHFQLGSYKQLPADQCDEALAYIAQMPGADGLRPADLAAGHTLPAIDVGALLLQGQSSPTIPLPADILQAIDQRAFVLAHEAYSACREHLTRAVAYRCETDKPRRINRARALALVSQCDLNQALAHGYYSRLRMIADLAECAQRTATTLYSELHQFANPNPPGALPG